MKKIIFSIFISILVVSCSSKETTTKPVQLEKNLNEQMVEAYAEGVKALEIGDGITAAKKFSEAEILYPQSIWAPRSSL